MDQQPQVNQQSKADLPAQNATSPQGNAAQSKQQTSKYNIDVKRDLCIGAASCVAVAPETFALDDENIAIIKNPAGNSDDSILMAAQACPTKAIYLFEKDKQIWPE